MEVTKKQVTEVDVLLTVTIAAEDYKPRAKKSLKALRKDVQMRGFRKGMVPLGLVKKMYGKKVLFDELGKLVQERLQAYLKEEKLDILGTPLPKEGDMLDLEYDSDKSYDFVYEIGCKPEFTIPVVEDDSFTITRYDIQLDSDNVEEHLKHTRNQLGHATYPTDISEGDSLNVTFLELDEATKEVKAKGITSSTWLPTNFFKEGEVREKVLVLEKGENVEINVFEDLTKTEEEVIKIVLNQKDTKLTAKDISPIFKMTVDEIKRWQNADFGLELYDKLFPGEEIKDEEAFHARYKDELKKSYETVSDDRLKNDLIEKLLTDTEINLPKDFLKRYLDVMATEPIPTDQFEEQFQGFIEGLRWQLIKNKLSLDLSLKVEEEEINERATYDIIQFFQQYGQGIPFDKIEDMVENRLKNEEYYNKTVDAIMENKIFLALKDKLNIMSDEISLDEFKALEKKEAPVAVQA